MLLGGACESESEVLSTKGLCHAEGCQADVSADPLTQAPGHNGLSALLWVASSSSGLEPSWGAERLLGREKWVRLGVGHLLGVRRRGTEHPIGLRGGREYEEYMCGGQGGTGSRNPSGSSLCTPEEGCRSLRKRSTKPPYSGATIFSLFYAHWGSSWWWRAHWHLTSWRQKEHWATPCLSKGSWGYWQEEAQTAEMKRSHCNC